MSLSQWFRSLIVLATIFLILGVGNLSFGHQRAEYYREAIQKLKETHHNRLETGAEQDELDEALPAAATLFDRAQMGEAELKLLQQTEQRYSYYRFCILGGKVFLAFATLLLAAAFLLRWRL